MKTLIALFAVLTLTSVQAHAEISKVEKLLSTQSLLCKTPNSYHESGYVGSLSIAGRNFMTRGARLSDNYALGRAVCEMDRSSDNTLTCVGLWAGFVSKADEYLVITLTGDAEGKISAKFKRSTFYGGKEVVLPCVLEEKDANTLITE